MKKTLLSIMAIACTMLAACNIPQIKRADVSFEGLKTFYVDSPKNGAEIFAKFGNAEQTNSIIVEEVAANLQSKGYERVAKREDAQMIFVPVWSVSIQSFDDVSDTANIVIAQNSAFTNSDFNSLDYYATLEIQAFLQGDPHWGWRGFSPIQTKADNITRAMLKNQITWALEYFPPELNPNPMSNFFGIFGSSDVTDAEVSAKTEKTKQIKAERQKAEKQAYDEAVARATATANAGKKAGEAKVAPTKEQIEAERKYESVADVDKAFNKALEERAAKKSNK